MTRSHRSVIQNPATAIHSPLGWRLMTMAAASMATTQAHPPPTATKQPPTTTRSHTAGLAADDSGRHLF